jgi:hypothetical protein
MTQTSTVDPAAYDLMVDWCCMVAQAGTGANVLSSILSFAMPVVLGTMDHLHEWAHNWLKLTLGKHTAITVPTGNTSQEHENNTQGHAPMGEVDVSMLAQVTAAVVAAIWAGEGGAPGRWE